MCECEWLPREQWVRADIDTRVRVREEIQRNNHIPLPGPQLPAGLLPMGVQTPLAPPLLPQPRAT